MSATSTVSSIGDMTGKDRVALSSLDTLCSIRAAMGDLYLDHRSGGDHLGLSSAGI
ncbi:MAG: hypothetical protein ACOYD4_01830 [Solirubrobacterales bacterium]